jgi:hypothetical protein
MIGAAVVGMEVPEVDGSRAITTETDRKKLAKAEGYDDSARYQAASLIRQRIENLEQDREFLAKHHPELLEELQQAFCE